MVYRGPSTACQNCRRRRIKCNGVRPTCAACERKGLQCNAQASKSVDDANAGITFIAYQPQRQLSGVRDESSHRQKVVQDRADQVDSALVATAVQRSASHSVPRSVVKPATREDDSLRHLATVFWPGLDPAAPHPAHVHPWLEAATNNQCLLQTMMWQANLHRLLHHQTPTLKEAAIRQNSRAIAGLARALPSRLEDVSEILLFCMTCLAVRLPAERTPSDVDSFRSPLTDLWWLDFFTCAPFIDAHLECIFRIVKANGGLERIAFPRLGCLIQYVDVSAASMRLEPPQLELTAGWKFISELEPRELSFGHDAVDLSEAVLTTSVYVRSLKLNAEICEVMLDLKVYASLVERYEASHLPNANLSRLACHRVMIQHRLLKSLSLDFSRIEDRDGADRDVNSAVRLGLLVFALGVTYPLACKAPLKLATDKLKASLETLHNSRTLYNTSLRKILLWACMLGAIASPSTSAIRLWFEERLIEMELLRLAKVRASGPQVGQSWAEIERSLRDIVWTTCACNPAASHIWSRVQAAIELYFAISN